MDNYDMDYWDEQGCHVEILIEKQSMAASFRKVGKGVQVVVIPTKGDDGLEDQYKHYKRWKRIQQEEGKDVHILFFSDLDVYGGNMEKTFKQKILQMIKLDIENYNQDPLNWDWKDTEDWNNFNECWNSLDSEKKHQILVKVLGQEFADNPATEKYRDLNDAKWKELMTEVYIAGFKNKVPFYENHYDKNKPSFTFERIGLTLDQVNELDLTKLDLISLHDIYYPPDQETKAYVEKVGKNRMIKWAKEHGNEFFATELDALLIANQYAFEEMVTDAVGKYHKKKVWNKVKDKLDSLWVEVELQKRVKFTDLSDKEYELWKKDQLVLDDTRDEGPTPTAIGMQANLTKEGKQRGLTKRQFNRTRKAKRSGTRPPLPPLSDS